MYLECIHKPSRWLMGGSGGVALGERRLRSLSLRFLSFFFFFRTGVLGVGGVVGSLCGEFRSIGRSGICGES